MSVHDRDEGEPRPVLWLVCWLGLVGLYRALAGSSSWAEMVAGGISALLATVAVIVSGNPEYLGRMRLGWWFLLLHRLPREVLSDTARVAGAVLAGRRLAGAIRSVPFEHGGDDSVSGSRRALVTAAASLAPNTYVVIIDRKHEHLVAHQLVPTEEPPGHGDRLWPI